jgi:hypothetical protein
MWASPQLCQVRGYRSGLRNSLGRLVGRIWRVIPGNRRPSLGDRHFTVDTGIAMDEQRRRLILAGLAATPTDRVHARAGCEQTRDVTGPPRGKRRDRFPKRASSASAQSGRRTASTARLSASPLRKPETSSWRRERDSNPRRAFDPYTLSRGAPSTTRPSLRDPGSASVSVDFAS